LKNPYIYYLYYREKSNRQKWKIEKINIGNIFYFAVKQKEERARPSYLRIINTKNTQNGESYD
jgi:hypothetical protein